MCMQNQLPQAQSIRKESKGKGKGRGSSEEEAGWSAVWENGRGHSDVGVASRDLGVWVDWRQDPQRRLGLRLSQSGGQVVVSALEPDSHAAAQLRCFDRILLLNGLVPDPCTTPANSSFRPTDTSSPYSSDHCHPTSPIFSPLPSFPAPTLRPCLRPLSRPLSRPLPHPHPIPPPTRCPTTLAASPPSPDVDTRTPTTSLCPPSFAIPSPPTPLPPLTNLLSPSALTYPEISIPSDVHPQRQLTHVPRIPDELFSPLTLDGYPCCCVFTL